MAVSDHVPSLATRKELEEALRSISAGDWKRLYRAAEFLAYTEDPGDAVHRALLQLLEGDRRWNKRFTIVATLRWILRSNAQNDFKKVRRREKRGEPTYPIPFDESILTKTEFEGDQDLLRLFEAQLRIALADDPEALSVLRAFEAGRTKRRDAREHLGMSEKQYDRTVKRLRRKASKVLTRVRNE